MNSGSPSDRLVTRRLRALGRTLPAAIDGDHAGVHKARVATRRIREALPVALADVPRRRARKVLRGFRHITRALGPVRELDVVLTLTADLQAAHPRLAPALDLVRRDVEDDRRHRRERMLAGLDALDFERLVERLGDAVERVGAAGEAEGLGHAPATVLTARVARRVRTLQRAIGAAGTLYAPEALHDVRIAVKKLRYTLELAGALRLLASGRLTARLKAVQGVLGRLHDRQVLIARVQRVQTIVPAEDREVLGQLVAAADLLEEECRELHATYITRRDQLAAVADATLEALARPATEPVSGATTIH